MKSYTLDSNYEINLFGLVFKDSISYVRMPKDFYLLLTEVERIKLIDTIITTLDRAISKGYLTSHDLRVFPIIS
jgi:hypothetical protein